MSTRSLALLICTSLSACGGGGGNQLQPSSPGSTPSPPPIPPAAKAFQDATSISNIGYSVSFTTPLATQGSLVWQVPHVTFGGIAAGDCDMDGDIDLFVTYGDGSNRPNRLYLNQLSAGNPLQFFDVAATAGVAYSRDDGAGNDRHSGPTFADMDGDGDLDLFMGGLFGDPNKVYENRGDCHFDDVTDGSGLDTLQVDNTISAAFGDYDLDGDLDLFLTHWGAVDEFPVDGQSEHLFNNVSDENGIRFVNVSQSSGVTASILAARLGSMIDQGSTDVDYTFTPTFARINDDIWPDIVIASDFGTSQVLLNGGLASPGQFHDATTDAVRSIQFGMGSALGDMDGDGDLDWFVSSIYADGIWGNHKPEGNKLMENSGADFAAQGFLTSSMQDDIADGGWGWGACFLDIDNDTDLDIYHTNGWPLEFAGELFTSDRSRMFIASDTNAFADNADLLGLNDTHSGRGVVCADFDNDGDIDILQHTDRQSNSGLLWENRSAAAGRNFLRVKLLGMAPNTEAAGARIFATIAGQTQMREIMIGSNYTSQNPTVQVFGLDTATSVDMLRVEWPTVLPEFTDPADWSKANVAAGVVGETLLICHPGLVQAPAACVEPD